MSFLILDEIDDLDHGVEIEAGLAVFRVILMTMLANPFSMDKL
jgi:hypothetical protein